VAAGRGLSPSESPARMADRARSGAVAAAGELRDGLLAQPVLLLLLDLLLLGQRQAVLPSALRPLDPSWKICGRAATLSMLPVSAEPEHAYALEMECIDALQPGEILVITTHGDHGSAVWGELLSTSARAHGAVGAVIDGLTRDAARMAALEPQKRYTLAVSLLAVQAARARDDVAEMFIKRMLAIHQKGKDALEQYRANHQSRTDALVLTLRDLVVAYGKEGTTDERLAAMASVIGGKESEVLQSCEEHLAHMGNNYQQFLWPFYKNHRGQLFRLLSVMQLLSSSQDKSMEEAIRFLKAHESSKGDWLVTATVQNPGTPEEQRLPLVDLTFASDAWWKFMTGQSKRSSCPDKVLRRHARDRGILSNALGPQIRRPLC